MDAHDVSSQHVDLLKKFKKTLEEAKKRQSERPSDRKPPEYAYMRFMMAMGPVGQNKPGHFIHTSFIAPAYPPCITPVADLKYITIDELLLETHHRGRYILLRCITPPNRMAAIMVLAEDKNKDVVSLQMYQQENEETRPATDIADTGIILLVKEPYYKMMSDGEYGLRADHLSDIVQLKSSDDRILPDWQPRVIELEVSAEELKLKGNLAMKEGKFWESIAIYSDALAQPTSADEADTIKRNRSLAFLRTKQFDAALSDTGLIIFRSLATRSLASSNSPI